MAGCAYNYILDPNGWSFNHIQDLFYATQPRHFADHSNRCISAAAIMVDDMEMWGEGLIIIMDRAKVRRTSDTAGELHSAVLFDGVRGVCGTFVPQTPQFFFLPAQDWAGPGVG